MYISKIELNNFRNLSSSELFFDRCTNLFLGNNGSGKTNILEAISFLSTVSSFRKINKLEFMKWGSKYCYLKCEIVKEEKTQSRILELGFDKTRKMGKVDGVVCKRLMDYLGNLTLIIFLPQDLNIVIGLPKIRRNFIDRITYNFLPGHLVSLQEYNKVRISRNAILKGIGKEYDEEILKIYDEQLVGYGSKVLLNRFSIIRQLNETLSEVYEKLTGERNRTAIKYISSLNIDLNEELQKISKTYSNSLLAMRKDEISKGLTVYGPHLDDIEFLVNDKRADLFSSLGQQRMLVIAVKLCEMIKFEEKFGECPVILLDDIFAGLDKDRVKSLIDFFPPKIQVFLTTTHLDNINISNTDKVIFNVSKGKIERCKS
ncbi:DNA replication/repair protein RecF [bacterium]|nr:DNA replication/repair protein RecF [bacterium]